MTTRTVTGNIKTLTDSAVSSGTVTFEKVVTSTTGNTIHQFGTTTATTDGSGDFSIALAVPASGSYRYRMILPNGDAFYFSIADGASVNVATLIVAETITDSDAIVEALAAYLPLSGGTMTGQLNFSGTTHAGIKLLSLTTAQRDALTPAAGMVIYNSTTTTVQVYQGGAWVSVGAGGGASDVDDLTTTTGTSSQMLRVAAAGGLEYRTVAQVLSDLRDSGALANPDLGVTVQGYSAKTAAIAALTWAANNIILLTGAATASVQALAAHVVTFIQSATAADARTAIGAGTGNGDVTAAAIITDNVIVTGDGGVKGVQGNVGAVSIDDSGRINTTDIMFGSDANARLYRISSSRVETASNFGVGNVFYVGNNQTVLRNGSEMQLGNSFTTILTPATIASVANNATTNAITNILTAGHNTSGTPAAGLGAAVNFTLETSTTIDTQAGRVAVLWETVTHASRVPDGVFYLTDYGAEREIWRGRANGTAAAIGFLGAAPVARQAHIADAAGDDAATVNAILDVLEAFGLVATS